MHRLLRQLLELKLPVRDYALFGSGPLLARGWIDDVGDLDVIARGEAWQKALRLGRLQRLDQYSVDVVAIGEMITVGTTWGIGDFVVDELISDAETIAGIRCVKLQHVIEYKRIADRPKDRRHLAIITERLAVAPPEQLSGHG